MLTFLINNIFKILIILLIIDGLTDKHIINESLLALPLVIFITDRLLALATDFDRR